jgi:hypothetical protein
VTGHRLEVADVFRQHEQEFPDRWERTLSFHQIRAFRDICACQTAELGAHLLRCDHCSHETIAFNSCRNRHCPKCQAGAREKWLAARSRELLPVPYCHVVFTLPAQLSTLALRNPQVVYNLFFQAVAETLLTIAADPRRLGARIGFLAVLHTWNQKLLHHPHLHCLIPAGGISLDGTRWLRSRKRFFLPVRVLGRMFRGKFLALLGAAFRKTNLRFPGLLEPLSSPTAFDRFIRQLRRLEWVVYAKPPLGADHVIRYLARYTHRVAISNGRLISLIDRRVTFRWRDSADGNKQKLLTVDSAEFVRRFLLHVLPRGFVKIRHFGFLSNRTRSLSLPLCRLLLQTPEAATSGGSQPPSLAAKCPVCRIGVLRTIALISATELEALLFCAPLDSS